MPRSGGWLGEWSLSSRAAEPAHTKGGSGTSVARALDSWQPPRAPGRGRKATAGRRGWAASLGTRQAGAGCLLPRGRPREHSWPCDISCSPEAAPRLCPWNAQCHERMTSRPLGSGSHMQATGQTKVEARPPGLRVDGGPAPTGGPCSVVLDLGWGAHLAAVGAAAESPADRLGVSAGL